MYGSREFYILTGGTPLLRTSWMDLFLESYYSIVFLANELTFLAAIQVTSPFICFRRVSGPQSP